MSKPVFVYMLKRGDEIVYVGESINPDLRFRQHTTWKPVTAVGKFYGQTDLTMEIEGEYPDKQTAYDKQTEIQISLGLKTDGQKNA